MNNLCITLCALVAVAIALYIFMKPSETYRRPYNCTDGCIYRQRNRGVFVDSNCQAMCDPEWSLQPTIKPLDPKQQFKLYESNLLSSIGSGAFVYNNGMLG